MSTPISQIIANPNFHSTPSDNSDLDDIMVAGVINDLQQEVQATQRMQQQMNPVMSATNVATFHHPPASGKSLMEALKWNPDDAKLAIIIAIIALVVLSPFDLSFVYEKIPALEPLKPYEYYVRGVVLAFIIYVGMRMFM